MSSDFVMDKLCSRCCSLFTEPPIIGDHGLYNQQSHQQSYQELKEAVEYQCWICQKVSGLLGSLPDRIDTKEDVNTSLYVSLRKPFFQGMGHGLGWLNLNCYVGQQRCSAVYWISNVTDQEVDTSPEYSGLEETTSSNDSLTRAQSWAEECASEHANCGRGYSNPQYIPTRLIHIGTDGDKWKLCDFRHSLNGTPSRLRYITLSYVWGQQRQQLMLQKSNMAKLQDGLPISTTLPKTFRDLVDVARRLSVEYLWIDALCIIQDCTQDWDAESRRMQAFFMRESSTKSVAVDCRLGRRAGPLAIRLFERHGWVKIFERSPLHRRGWALQERILSPRILYFAEDQILFECDTHKRCEVYQARINKYYLGSDQDHRVHSWHTSNTSVEAGRDIEPENALKFFNGWGEVVQQYSRCSLTKRSDKLVGTRGLAMLYQKLSGDEYLSGLWRSHIWSSLVWYTEDPSSTANYDIAPSYSWAAVDNEIEWDFDYGNYDDAHPFSFVHGDSECLILRGYAPMYDPRCCSTTLQDFLKGILGIEFFYEDLLPSCSEHYLSAATGTLLYFLPLCVKYSERKSSKARREYAYCQGIVVRSISGVEVEGRLQCRRVGSFRTPFMKDLSAFGLYVDMEGKIHEQGLNKIDFELR